VLDHDAIVAPAGAAVYWHQPVNSGTGAGRAAYVGGARRLRNTLLRDGQSRAGVTGQIREDGAPARLG
jgi:hypothetical protein